MSVSERFLQRLMQLSKYVGSEDIYQKPPSKSPHSLTPIISRQFLQYCALHLLHVVLAWAIVILFGIRYIVDYIKLRRRLHKLQDRPEEWYRHQIPLCAIAHTKHELYDLSLEERWKRLWIAILEETTVICKQQQRPRLNAESVAKNGDTISIGNSKGNYFDQEMIDGWENDNWWIKVFHSSLTIRREASYFMYQLFNSKTENSLDTENIEVFNQIISKTNQSYKIDIPESVDFMYVYTTIQRLWSQFLQFPDSIRRCAKHRPSSCHPYKLSLIIPMYYKETIQNVQRTIYYAYKNSSISFTNAGSKDKKANGGHHDDSNNAKTIQVIIVYTPNYTSDDDENKAMTERIRQQLLLQERKQMSQSGQAHDASESSSSILWGELQVISVPKTPSGTTSGGRGKALNVGIQYAKAPILTFLHADTIIPRNWNLQIQQTLLPNGNDQHLVFPLGCAFTMGIDRKDEKCSNTNKQRIITPPGVCGAEWLGILRCHCGLIYGDSILSFTKAALEYIGGFPEQPLMEDYELMDWLRVRSILLNKAGSKQERFILLKDQAKCSPRRWQKYGVAYTSLINSICIYRYRQQNATAEELFDFYYHSASNNDSEGGMCDMTLKGVNYSNGDYNPDKLIQKSKIV